MVDHIVIIGSGAAGSSAAVYARKTNRQVKITMINEEPRTEYSRCSLPYAVSGVIPSFKNLYEYSPEFYKKYVKANLVLNARVMNVDVKSKKITFINLSDSQINEMTYDMLILATGAKPKKPPIKGLDKKNIFTLHTIDDGLAIQSAARNSKHAVVVGAGLIGLEMAESFHKLGLSTSVIEFLPGILLTMLDMDMTHIIQDRAESMGVKIYTNHLVKEIHGYEKPSFVTIENRETNENEEIPADIVLLATGVSPRTELAELMGLKIGASGAIRVNNRMETSIKSIFAVGDCIESTETLTKQPIHAGLATLAVRQGKTAGINAAGGNASLNHVFVAK
ncbi:MAG: FAD/NAD(P)-binding oxidoreductase, partial [Candidatus Hodarchaeota archaeon]